MRRAVLLLRNRPHYGANIVSLPAIHVARKYARTDHLTVIANPGLQQFYAAVPWVDAYREGAHLLDIYAQVPYRADLFYSMRPSMSWAGLIAAMRRARFSIGLVKSYKAYNASNPLNRLFDYCHDYSKQEYRAVSYVAPLIQAFALPNTAEFYMREALLDLAGKGGAAPTGRVCMMPGTGGSPLKKWGIDNYYALAQALHERHSGLSFDFVLGPGEAHERAFLEARQGTGLPFAMHNSLSLAANVALVESSALVIANDCGPSHIAQCLQRPFIGFYRQNDPEWFFSHEHSAAFVPETGAVIKDIPVTRVLEQAQGMLKSATPA